MQSFKMPFHRLLIAFATLFSVEILAYAPSEGNVSASLGSFTYRTNFAGSGASVKSPVMNDFGILLNGDVNEKGGLEIALFHMNKVFFRDLGANFVSEQTELIQIEMGYRRWINPQFSAGLNFYSSYSIGDPVTLHNDFAPANVLDTSARDTTEYGVDLSLQIEIWSEEKASVILDGRYSLSVTSRPNERGDHYGMFLAYRYLVQEKFSQSTK